VIAVAVQDAAPREEVGMAWTADVVLLVGGGVVTILLLAVFVPFMVRIWREDAPTRRARGGSGR
jgi:hypothetical protein